MKKLFFLTKGLLLSILCLLLVQCKKSPSSSASTNGAYKPGSSFPNELRAGLILRYDRAGDQDKLIVYIDSVDESKKQCVIQYLYLDHSGGKRYFYETRIVPLDNFKYSHKISHSFSLNGGFVENMGTMNTFFGSEEIIKQLNKQGDTTFSVETNRSVTSLIKTDADSHELLYNGKKAAVPTLQAQTGPLNSRFHTSFPIWFHNQPKFPLLLRYSQDILSSIDDVGRIAGLLRDTLESKQSLLTGSLYFAIYNLSGSATRRELMTVSKSLWAQAILPVANKNPTKKLVVEIFPVQNGTVTVGTEKNRDLSQVIQHMRAFLAASLSPDRLVVQAGSSIDKLPEETSPIGSDPEFRVLIRLE